MGDSEDLSAPLVLSSSTPSEQHEKQQHIAHAVNEMVGPDTGQCLSNDILHAASFTEQGGGIVVHWCERVRSQSCCRNTPGRRVTATKVPFRLLTQHKDAEQAALQSYCDAINDTGSWNSRIAEEKGRERRRILIVINPMSGTRQGQAIWEARCSPILEAANVSCQVVLTERSQHATEIAHRLDLSEYDGVVGLGGDGILYELIEGPNPNPTPTLTPNLTLRIVTQNLNLTLTLTLSLILEGLMSRPDWPTAIQMPLAIIPAGTGNGLAISILHSKASRHPWGTTTA